MRSVSLVRRAFRIALALRGQIVCSGVMRLALLAPSLASIVVAGLLMTQSARADVGPRAPCPPGTRHEYNRGHHCVPDGSHLEQGPNGEIMTVKDGSTAPTSKIMVDPPVAPPTPASAAPSASPTPSSSAAPSPSPTAETSTGGDMTSAPAPPGPPPTPPAQNQHGCACDITDMSSSGTGMALAAGAMALGFALRARGKRR